MSKKGIFIAVVVAMSIALVISHAVAKQFLVGGRPLQLYGYVTQNMGVSLHSENYDTEEGVNAAMFNMLLEGKYRISKDLDLYASGGFSMDWIYDLKDDD